MNDEITLTLNSPITEEQWDMLTDVDFDNTNEITFHTKHGKEVLFVKRMIAAIGYEAQKRKWIPCSEQLPEVGQDILMSVGGMYAAEGCLRADGDWRQFRLNPLLSKDMVGAWMPLPEPYKMEVENDTD